MISTPRVTSPSLQHLALRAAFPSSWHHTSTTALLVTLLALLIPLAYFLFRRFRMHNGSASPFRFMELPPELRDMVYEYLLEDPYYPPPPPCAKHHGSPLNWIVPSRWPSATAEQGNRGRKSNWIFLANKQVYAEYNEISCKKSTFHLTVSPNNYPKPVSGNTSSPSATNQKIWTIAPDTLKQVRKCDIKLITTSSMLGVPDPRNMTSGSWALAHQVRSELQHVAKVEELNLHVKAIGDPLWNPLWVWYHASQAFKTMGSPQPSQSNATYSSPSSHTPPSTEEDKHMVTATATAVSAGPKLNRITFSLDTWSPGENYLERDPSNKNQWAWWCMKGHCVGPDGGADMTVRQFCNRLYLECRVCRPELESEEHD